MHLSQFGQAALTINNLLLDQYGIACGPLKEVVIGRRLRCKINPAKGALFVSRPSQPNNAWDKNNHRADEKYAI